jgi:cysteine desulfurase
MPTPAPHTRVYLDHAAATPLAAEVAAAMQEAAAVAFANPSSPHAAGRAAKRILEDARERVLGLLGCRTSGPHRDRLVFTSGATEANRLGILGLAGEWAEAPPVDATAGRSPAGGWIAISARDHASIRLAAGELAGRGWTLVDAPLSAAGSLDGNAMSAALSQSAAAARRILAVTTVCGQTGIREDVGDLEDLLPFNGGVLVHADATQATGWDAVDFAGSPWDTLTLAPHKFGGPRGIGGLVVRGGVSLVPIVPGSQELGLRGGTEAVPLAAGFARALELATAERVAATERLGSLRQQLEAGVVAAARAAGFETLVVGAAAPRAPHVTLVAVADVDRQAVAMAADIEGVCLATGTACASGSSQPPAILAALGVPPRYQTGGLRLSLGRGTTPADVETAVAALVRVFARLQSQATSAG